MFTTSSWPLSSDGIRFIVPEFIVRQLQSNPLTHNCHPLALGYYPNAHGHRMERFHHDDNLLIYCTEGKGHIQTGQKHSTQQHATINPGELVILPKGVSHTYSADRANPWSIYWVHFAGDLSEQYLRAMEVPLTQMSVIRPGGRNKLIADFESLLEVRQTGYNPKSFTLASAILQQILSFLAVAQTSTKSSRGQELDLEGIHAFMQERLHGQLDLDTLAAKVNLSKYHFSNKYKTQTGQSPIQHFLHLKMERACYLLDISGISIKDVSANLGYEDSYYFSRLFKKIIGVSPRQYRQLQRG